MTKRFPFILIVLFAGCRPPIPADEGFAPISTVKLPKSGYSVCLYGPSRDDDAYYYCIFGADLNFSSESFSLGKVQVDETVKPTLQKVSPDVFRITWGSEADAPYVVIDVAKKQIVEDSNPDSKPNRPLVLE
jgi:hypothetical protein